MFPISLGFGPDGGLYVSMPAFGADNGGGTVSRLDLTGAAAAVTPVASCAPVGAATPAA
jgi:hypothetical protein